MNDDPSRLTYTHKFSKAPETSVEHELFHCKECSEFFYTKNKLAEHRLDRHSNIPLDLQKFRAEEHRNGIG
jgi:hypothetical protein